MMKQKPVVQLDHHKFLGNDTECMWTSTHAHFILIPLLNAKMREADVLDDCAPMLFQKVKRILNIAPCKLVKGMKTAMNVWILT